MERMVRKQVYIQAHQQRVLKRRAREQGITEAEVVRRAIEREGEGRSFRGGYPDPDAWQEARAFIVSRMGQGTTAGGRRWTREEIYRDRMSRHDR